MDWKNKAYLFSVLIVAVSTAFFVMDMQHDVVALKEMNHDLQKKLNTIYTTNQGPIGPKGDQGPPGPQGIQGLKGEPGDPIDTNHLKQFVTEEIKKRENQFFNEFNSLFKKEVNTLNEKRSEIINDIQQRSNTLNSKFIAAAKSDIKKLLLSFNKEMEDYKTTAVLSLAAQASEKMFGTDWSEVFASENFRVAAGTCKKIHEWRCPVRITYTGNGNVEFNFGSKGSYTHYDDQQENCYPIEKYSEKGILRQANLSTNIKRNETKDIMLIFSKSEVDGGCTETTANSIFLFLENYGAKDEIIIMINIPSSL